MAGAITARDKRNFENTLKEARIGTLDAQYELALMYANGVGVPADIDKAIHWLQQAAQRGLAAAQLLLATRYLGGIGVPRDEAMALLWLTRAAAQGHPKAVFRLGRFLEDPHPETARACLKQASDAGLPEAECAWARSAIWDAPDPQTLVQARTLLGDLAERGHAPAAFALGVLHEHGQAGTLPDFKLALQWYRRAVGLGSVAGRAALGRLDAAGRSRSGNGRRTRGGERRQVSQDWIDEALQGDADTRYHLGVLYENGWGVPVDPVAALQCYRSAALQGEVRAQYALGRLLESQQQADASIWYSRAAESGDAEAQFALARLLSAGDLVVPDNFRGLDWYMRAADQDHPAALLTVASVLEGDLRAVAQNCYERAAALGVAEAQYEVGVRLLASAKPELQRQAQTWLQRAAAQDHPAATCAAALQLLEGRGVPAEPIAAVAGLRHAAEMGDARAQWNLGALYAGGGGGLSPDIAQALDWCHQAAKQGFAAAQSTLGSLYARMQRWSEAQTWLERAAEQDDPEALANLALLALQGKFSDFSKERALTLMERAAELGISRAQSRLGLAFVAGDGAALDPIEAHKWFVIAAENGDSAAAANLQRSETLLGSIPLAEARRRAVRWQMQFGHGMKEAVKT